jgi:RNA polymerase sigma-70 factor, ECF subfamily
MQREADRVFDEYLVVMALAGSRPALSRLVERWSPRLLAFAARTLGEADGARDVVQETWAGALAGLPRLSDPARFPGWIFGIAHRRCADHVRSAARRRRLGAQAAEAALTPAGPDPPGPAERLDLSIALARLPPDQRSAVGLYYGEGLSVEEIAEALGLPDGTIKSRLHAARQTLKKFLEGGSS